MKRLFLLLAISCNSLLAQGSRFPQFVGFIPNSGPNRVSCATSAAGRWCAFSFVPQATKTLSTLAVSGIVTGTLGSGDITASIESTTPVAGGTSTPSGTVLETSTSTTPATVVTGTVVFNGFTGSYTAGTQYWVVIKNANGTPASNYLSVYGGANASAQTGLTSVAALTWASEVSTDSGSTWTGASVNYNIWGLRLDWSDSTHDGFLATNYAQTGTTNGVFAANQIGVKFTLPANVTLQVTGVSMWINREVGTPTGNLQYCIYTGGTTTPTLLAHTNGVAHAQFAGLTTTNQGWLRQSFTSTQTIAGGTTVRVTMCESTQSDTSSNRWDTVTYTIDSAAASEALTPFGATVQTATSDGITFTDTATAILPFVLILDGAAPWTASAGGGQMNAAYVQ